MGERHAVLHRDDGETLDVFWRGGKVEIEGDIDSSEILKFFTSSHDFEVAADQVNDSSTADFEVENRPIATEDEMLMVAFRLLGEYQIEFVEVVEV